MELSLPTKNQLVKVLKAAAYISISAGLDFLIHQTTDTQFGVLTPIINLALVTCKQVVSKDQV